MDSGRVFAEFTLLYGTAANVNTHNSAVLEEMKMGNNRCQQQEGFRESWEKERSGRAVTNLGGFLSPRGRLWVTFEENRDKAMPGVRGDVALWMVPSTGVAMGKVSWWPPCLGPRGRGAVGADPCSSQFLHSAAACLSSKHEWEDKKQKHQQERFDSQAAQKPDVILQSLLSPGKLGLLHLCLGVSEHLPPRKKAWFRTSLVMISVGFLVMGLCNHSHVYGSDVQHNLRLPWGSFVAGDASWGHRAPQEFPAGHRISCSQVQ